VAEVHVFDSEDDRVNSNEPCGNRIIHLLAHHDLDVPEPRPFTNSAQLTKNIPNVEGWPHPGLNEAQLEVSHFI
jgi:hypothetical protein